MCRKTKTKVITLTNHNSRKQSNEPCSRQARENAYRQATIVLVLLLIVRKSGARYFSESQTVAMQNQSNWEITFDTQLQTVLMAQRPARKSYYLELSKKFDSTLFNKGDTTDKREVLAFLEYQFELEFRNVGI